MSLHAFMDESRRGSTYLVVVVFVRPRRLDLTRTALRRLVKPGQRRTHFKKEGDPRRREIVARLHELGLRAMVWTCVHKDDVVVRQMCLAAVAVRLAELGVAYFVVESCKHQDSLDRATLAEVLGKNSELTYGHLRPVEDPILWVSDAIAWCYGAGGDWRRRVSGLLDEVIALDGQ